MTLELIRNPLLSERTTLRLGGPALAELVVRAEEDVDRLGPKLERLGGRPFPIGAGSNLLAAGGEAGLALLRAQNVGEPEILRQTDGRALVRAPAGLGLPRLLGFLRRRGLAGLEGLTGIPGKVGGAVAMNAGSFGVETCGRLTRVRLWTPRRGLFWREAANCARGYRFFDPQADETPWLIWEAEFALVPDDPDRIRARMKACYAKKKASQPVTAQSAGCVFKNPEGAEGAGRLLEEAGMRGKKVGQMAFSAVHANFLVNLGGGTVSQALELMELGRAAVRERSGVELENEVVVLEK